MTDAPAPPGPVSLPRRSQAYRDPVLLLLAALVFLADQFTKSLVREFLDLWESVPAEGFFRISHTYNTGSAFGLFQGHNAPLILASQVGVVVLIAIYYSQRRPTLLLRLSLGLQLGGAFGNLIDRVLLGRVTDFLDVGAWPVFNLADASIVTGIVLLGWIFLLGGRDPEAQREAARVGPSPAFRPGSGDPSAPTTTPGVRLGPLDNPYSRCPVCDGDMRASGLGWRCSTCGVRERIVEAEERLKGRACGGGHGPGGLAG